MDINRIRQDSKMVLAEMPIAGKIKESPFVDIIEELKLRGIATYYVDGVLYVYGQRDTISLDLTPQELGTLAQAGLKFKGLKFWGKMPVSKLTEELPAAFDLPIYPGIPVTTTDEEGVVTRNTWGVWIKDSARKNVAETEVLFSLSLPSGELFNSDQIFALAGQFEILTPTDVRNLLITEEWTISEEA